VDQNFQLSQQAMDVRDTNPMGIHYLPAQLGNQLNRKILKDYCLSDVPCSYEYGHVVLQGNLHDLSSLLSGFP
jgi:hypothetical protein